MAGAGTAAAARARRRFCSHIASQPRRLILGVVIICFFAVRLFRRRLRRFNRRCCRRRLNWLRSRCGRGTIRWQQGTPLPPNDGIQFAHGLNGVCANRDLPPIRAVRNGEARNGSSAASGQVNDATRILRRRDTSGDRCCVVGKGWNLDLFTRTNPLKAARLKFAHNLYYIFSFVRPFPLLGERGQG